jgi:hypothetical protein
VRVGTKAGGGVEKERMIARALVRVRKRGRVSLEIK